MYASRRAPEASSPENGFSSCARWRNDRLRGPFWIRFPIVYTIFIVSLINSSALDRSLFLDSCCILLIDLTCTRHLIAFIFRQISRRTPLIEIALINRTARAGERRKVFSTETSGSHSLRTVPSHYASLLSYLQIYRPTSALAPR